MLTGFQMAVTLHGRLRPLHMWVCRPSWNHDLQGVAMAALAGYHWQACLPRWCIVCKVFEASCFMNFLSILSIFSEDVQASRHKISSQSYRVCWITKAMTPCIADTGAQRSTNAPHIYIYIIFYWPAVAERLLYDIGRNYDIHRQKMELSDNKNPQQKLGSVAVADVAPKTLTRVSQTLVPNGQPMLIIIYMYIFIHILFFIDGTTNQWNSTPASQDPKMVAF